MAPVLRGWILDIRQVFRLMLLCKTSRVGIIGQKWPPGHQDFDSGAFNDLSAIMLTLPGP